MLIGRYKRPFSGIRQEDQRPLRAGHEHPRHPGPCGELYGIEILPGLVSGVTDSVIDEVTAW